MTLFQKQHSWLLYLKWWVGLLLHRVEQISTYRWNCIILAGITDHIIVIWNLTGNPPLALFNKKQKKKILSTILLSQPRHWFEPQAYACFSEGSGTYCTANTAWKVPCWVLKPAQLQTQIWIASKPMQKCYIAEDRC